MENASKALLMAGGVLIGLLIITLAVYLFTSFGTTSAEVNKKNQEQQLVQFNTQYTTYLGRTIIVKIGNTRIDNKSQSDIDNLILVNQTNTKYECTDIEYYDTSGRVKQVTFKQIP